ncbi:hypothetical protein CMK11_01970 [Candidatus Poribacteria bacterium]|nr:hypothetical protein [Candidatus Poribacteria bacterium]
MQGLELCRRFFLEVGMPAIRARVPEGEGRFAAGIAGGSECHGADDEVSRDHGWGPGFTLWVGEEDHDRLAEPLRAALADLPRTFLGHGWAKESGNTCRVMGIAPLIEHFVGSASPPEVPIEWLHVPEEWLFELASVQVFHDPTGEVSNALAAFAAYPDDVRRQRLSACLFWAWEWGVKHLERAEARGDDLAAAMYWGRYATYAMKTGLLLHRRYAPYHKWIQREFGRLPDPCGELARLLLLGFHSPETRRETVATITEAYGDLLRAEGYDAEMRPDSARTAYTDHVLLAFARSVRRSITDADIRALRSQQEALAPPVRPTWAWVAPPR